MALIYAPTGNRGGASALIRLVCWLLALLLLPVPAIQGQSRAEQAEEYAVKAAFLYNFSKFVEWPAAPAGNAAEERLYLCIFGQDPFGAALDAIRDKPVRHQTLKIQPCQSLNDLQSNQILFVPASERARLGEILKRCKGYPILTVSDAEGFAEQGGMIALVADQGRIRFVINDSAARAAGLRISSQLLKLALRVIE